MEPDATRNVDPALLARLESGPSRSLAASSQRFSERVLGRSVRDVRLYSGPDRAELLEEYGAQAMAYRDTIVLADDPGSREGQAQLVHELSHVFHYRDGRLRGPRGKTLAAGDALEREAEAAEQAARQNRSDDCEQSLAVQELRVLRGGRPAGDPRLTALARRVLERARQLVCVQVPRGDFRVEQVRVQVKAGQLKTDRDVEGVARTVAAAIVSKLRRPAVRSAVTSLLALSRGGKDDKGSGSSRPLGKRVAEKRKTGDAENIRMLHAALASLAGDELDSKLRSCLEQLGDPAALVEAVKADPHLVIDPARRASPPGEALCNLSRAVELLVQRGCNRQFVTNLIMLDFRTAGGARLRKATATLRSGADGYARPFESELPRYPQLLLSQLNGGAASSDGSLGGAASSGPALLKLPAVDGDGEHVPPTRFTASFPLHLAGARAEEGPLRNARLPDAGGSADGRATEYTFMESFGFAEPGYCTWSQSDAAESDGTRLSLGAYSLNTPYLRHLRTLLNALQGSDRRLYAQYGGVGIEHVEMLIQKFETDARKGWNAGMQLAVSWVDKLREAARQLAMRAADATPQMARFFEMVLGKIEKRGEKLAFLRGYPDTDTQLDAQHLFDKLWVIESTLWELALLSATCLTGAQVEDAFRGLFPRWSPTVGSDSGSLRETLHIACDSGEASAMERVYFPSGTAAADSTHEQLREEGYQAFTFKADRELLSTFTPYFEFYQQQTSFLNPARQEELEEARGGAASSSDSPATPRGRQLWLNLSDGLHAELLKTPGSGVGARIAELLLPFIRDIQRRQRDTDAKLFLVIDYTKFAADMPNSRIYPILTQLAEALRRSLGSVDGVVFLRSNLKYNTGTIDRYQSGEMMLPEGNSVSVGDGLHDAAQRSFAPDNEWNLGGEYIPLMKKLYLMHDALGQGRWDDYSALWASKPDSGLLPAETVANRRALLAIFDGLEPTLSPIFTNLLEDFRSRPYKEVVPESSRTQIREYWQKLCADIEKLRALTSRVGLEVQETLARILTYFERDLGRVEGLLTEAIRATLPAQKAVKQDLLRYRDRVRSAREKLAAQLHSADLAGV